MIGDISVADNIYLLSGRLSGGIDKLTAVVQEEYNLDPLSNSIFVFCAKRGGEMRILYWEGDGFILITKRLEDGRYCWPRTTGKKEAMLITKEQFEWLSCGLRIDQKKTIRRPSKVIII